MIINSEYPNIERMHFKGGYIILIERREIARDRVGPHYKDIEHKYKIDTNTGLFIEVKDINTY